MIRRRESHHMPAAHDIRSSESNQQRTRVRMTAMAFLVLLCFGLLVWRWAVLQVQRHDNYRAQAESNRTALVPIPPSRGDILDRNGVVLATNYSAYVLELTPAKTDNVDATIDELAGIVTITEADRKRFHRLRQDSKAYEPVPLRTRLTDAEIARIATQRFRFPGVQVNARLFRYYPYGDLAGHVIGYIGRISQQEKEDIEESDAAANYRGTEYMGKLGIEQSYEAQLHGTSGSEQMETTAGGNIVRRLTSTPSTPGHNVILSIDIRLQKLVEDLFGNRRGALVAIDPRDGQILAMVSKPTFDPNLFVDGIDRENWAALNESIDKPLLNRALRGTYPPGSTYKPFMALAALETGKRNAATTIYDPGFWIYGNHRFRSGHALGSVNLRRSIVHSSNVYYYSLAHEMGVQAIHDFMKPLGFGQITGVDLPGEVRGILPSPEWKRRAYKRALQQKWLPGETISLGIGQGYNNFTMLQLAHALATLVNGGRSIEPRVALRLEEPTSHATSAAPRSPAVELGFRPQHVQMVKDAMVGVTQEGTGSGVFAAAGYVSGGKTGTAQAVTIGQNQKYNAALLAERKRDHSLYIAFAPASNPTIAVAVIVENAGFGATAAAPIARRVLDYWLLGQYPSAEDIAAAQHGKATAPIGPRRAVASMPWPPADLHLTQPLVAVVKPLQPAMRGAASAPQEPLAPVATAAPPLTAAPLADAASGTLAGMPAPGTAPAAQPASAPPAYVLPPALQHMTGLFRRSAPGASAAAGPASSSAPAALAASATP